MAYFNLDCITMIMNRQLTKFPLIITYTAYV